MKKPKSWKKPKHPMTQKALDEIDALAKIAGCTQCSGVSKLAQMALYLIEEIKFRQENDYKLIK